MIDKQTLDPVATILLGANLDTVGYSQQFKDDHGGPPTVMAKSHHLRSCLQAKIRDDKTFDLDPEYSEYGRVQFSPAGGGQTFLLRGTRAVSIENAKDPLVLFDDRQYLQSPVVLVAFMFHSDGLDLYVAGTRRRVGRRRLEPSGEMHFIATWPYTADATRPFDQGIMDSFDDLADERDEADEE